MLRKSPGLRGGRKIGHDMPKMSCIAGGPVRRTAAVAAGLVGMVPKNGTLSLISSLHAEAPQRRL